jgi:hypothetical protein
MSDSPEEAAKRRGPSPTVLGVGAVALVVVALLVLVIVNLSSTQKRVVVPPPKRAPASLVSLVTSVPESVFEQVGLPSEIQNYPKTVSGHPALSNHGLPEVLYVGAEYCPFCAAERWAMVMALSKFGTFSGLKTTHSSPTDFAPNTPTFTFSGSSYSSKYVSFAPYELATNEPASRTSTCNVSGYGCLDIPPTAAYDLFEKLGGGSFPFMDFGNKLVQAGAGFEDQPLALQNLTPIQVANQLYVPGSAVAQAEDGSANYVTAAICAITDDQPGSVCSASYVKPAQGAFGLQ